MGYTLEIIHDKIADLYIEYVENLVPKYLLQQEYVQVLYDETNKITISISDMRFRFDFNMDDYYINDEEFKEDFSIEFSRVLDKIRVFVDNNIEQYTYQIEITNEYIRDVTHDYNYYYEDDMSLVFAKCCAIDQLKRAQVDVEFSN